MRETDGTSKKHQLRCEAAAHGANDYITAALERAGVEDGRRAYAVQCCRFVDRTGDADVGLYFLDKPARRRAADRLAGDDAVTFRFVGRRMAYHQERSVAAHLLVAILKRLVDFLLRQLRRRPKRGDLRAAASEDREPIKYRAFPVQRDALGFEVGDHFALIEVA